MSNSNQGGCGCGDKKPGTTGAKPTSCGTATPTAAKPAPATPKK